MHILVIDDHPMYLEAAVEQISRAIHQVSVLSSYTLADAIDILSGNNVNLILLDYSMPGADGLNGLKAILAVAGKAPVVVTSGVANEAEVLACITAGARGFIPKTLDGTAFVAAATLVLNGGSYVPVEFVTAALRSAQPTATVDGRPAEPPAPPTDDGQPPVDLSPRERRFLEMVVAGASNKEIARTLDLQEATVKYYLSHIFRKIGARKRSQAAAIAVSTGLVPE